MKNLLLTAALACTVGLTYGQFRVVAPDGNCIAGGTDPGVANLKSQGTSELELALDAVAGNPDFSMQSNNETKGQFLFNNGNGRLQIRVDAANTGAGGLSGATSRITADGTNGNVGIGSNAPAFKLDVQGTIASNGVVVTSDARTKENVNSFNKGLNELMSLNTYSYTYKSDYTDNTEEVRVGVMAQDLQKVAPELVSTYVKEYWVEKDSESPARLERTEELMAINPDGLIFMLVNAVKEQQSQLDEIASALENNTVSSSTAVVNNTVSIKGDVERATLGQNVPNPFSANTKIEYSIPSRANFSQIVFTDLNGNQIKSVEINHTGNGSVDVNVKGLATGVYSYTLIVDGIAQATKKMIIE